jgi:predicted ester cyclase
MTNADIVLAFYTDALTVNTRTTPAAALEALLSDNFISENNQEKKTKQVMTNQFAFFWQLMPDLHFDVKETIANGNKVIVRSVATAAPRGNFMGIDCDGSKRFTIDTIDIHTVENGKICHVYHLEDWATAIAQLKA